ncbi:hypothetical protein [Ottowia testudinis]|uniref:Uncharacterized protein n=1 Tax=Ottowia testudinis TaxID=2816950 RepID=A0A975CHU5_9BURK|nr:hypothetical protein [Ottowia testudinis]QTD46703.1 hypothetical protein J1M35_07475 [Ottowia testudinis]
MKTIAMKSNLDHSLPTRFGAGKLPALNAERVVVIYDARSGEVLHTHLSQYFGKAELPDEKSLVERVEKRWLTQLKAADDQKASGGAEVAKQSLHHKLTVLHDATCLHTPFEIDLPSGRPVAKVIENVQPAANARA